MQKNSQKKKYFVLPALFFAAILLVPAIWLFGPKVEYLPLEKDYAASWPALEKEDFLSGQWGTDVESYLADQMPARSFWVGLNSYFTLLTGRQNSSDVIVDKAGNLLEAPITLDEAQLAKHLSVMVDFAENTGLPTTLLVPPTAGYCAKDEISDIIWSSYPDDALFSAIHQQVAGSMDVIDLRSEFLASDVPLFYATDHHWNAEGSFRAYLAICNQLGLSPLAKEAFTVAEHDGFYGSTYSRSGLYLTEADSLQLWDAGCRVKVSFSDKDETFDSLFFVNHLEEPDKYTVFLDSNHPVTVIENLDNPEGDVLLLVKDSYANSLAPLLAPHYSKLVLVDLRYYKGETSTLAAEHGADNVLIIYSAEHIVGDKNIIWLR